MKQSGFTLIELLISLTLMAVIAVLTWHGLDTLFRTKEYTYERLSKTAILQNIFAQWKFDLDAMQPVNGLSPAGIDFDGQTLRVIRRSGNGQSGLQVIAWTLRSAAQLGQDTGQWMRWVSPPTTESSVLRQAWQQAERWGKTPNSEGLVFQTVLIPLNQWQVTYFLGNAWFNPLSSLFTHEFESSETQTRTKLDKNQPIEAIKLVLDFPTSSGLEGRVTLDWVSPTFTPNQ